MMKYRSVAVTTLTGMALLAGCSSSSSSKTLLRPEVVDDWTTTIRSSGYISVLPINEDIRVGDMFVYSSNPEDESFFSDGAALTLAAGAGTMRWGALDVDGSLQTEYSGRGQWNATPIGELVGDGRSWPGGEDIGGDHPRSIGFGALSTITFQGAVASGLIPTEATDLAPGTSWSDAKAVTVRIADAETYGLSLSTILGELVEQTDDGHFLASPYRDEIGLFASGDNEVWLRVVGEVAFVRAVDIAIELDSEEARLRAQQMFAIQAAAAQAENNAAADDDAASMGVNFTQGNTDTVEVAMVPSSARSSAGSHQPGHDVPRSGPEFPPLTLEQIEQARQLSIKESLKPFDWANTVNSAITEHSLDTLPNSTLKFMSMSIDSVAIRRFFRNGMAFAVRGVTLEIEGSTGRILRITPMGSEFRPYPKASEQDESDDS